MLTNQKAVNNQPDRTSELEHSSEVLKKIDVSMTPAEQDSIIYQFADLKETLDLIFSKTENIKHGLIMKMEQNINNAKQDLKKLEFKILTYRQRFKNDEYNESNTDIIAEFIEEFQNL